MPIYSFTLRDGSGILEDENGVELPDDDSATNMATMSPMSL
jgi:hypothetical protein